MNFKIILLICIIFCCLISKILSSCIAELSRDVSLRPTLQKKIGSHTAVLSNESPIIEIQENQELIAKCGTRFRKYINQYCKNLQFLKNTKKSSFRPSEANGKSMIQLKCVNNKFIGYYQNRFEMECDSIKWNLYESSTPFRWCPSSTVSYIIARPSMPNEYEYLAGICYNFDEMEVSSVHYTVGPRSPTNLVSFKITPK